MKRIIYLGILCLGVFVSACKSGANKEIQVQNENLRLLNQKMTEQEQFMQEAKRVLAEHRSHLMVLEEQVSKLSGGKKITDKKAQPAKAKKR